MQAENACKYKQKLTLFISIICIYDWINRVYQIIIVHKAVFYYMMHVMLYTCSSEESIMLT